MPLAWTVGQHLSRKQGTGELGLQTPTQAPLALPLASSHPQGLGSNRRPQGSRGVGRKGWGCREGRAAAEGCSSSEKAALGPLAGDASWA